VIRSRSNQFTDAKDHAFVCASNFALLDREGDYYTGAAVCALLAFADGKIAACVITVINVPSGGLLAYAKGAIWLRDSFVQRTGKLGLQACEGSHVEIEAVTFEETTGDGVALTDGVTGFIRRCRFTKHTIGVELTNMPDIKIATCEFIGNSGTGVALFNASPVVRLVWHHLILTIRSCNETSETHLTRGWHSLGLIVFVVQLLMGRRR
jgi:hypothetical protein